MSCGKPSWQLLLDCARSLASRGLSPFARAQLIACVQQTHPERDRASLDPTIQGMTKNAPGGPPSAAGVPFVRVARGLYALGRTMPPAPPVLSGPTRDTRVRPGRRNERIARRQAALIADFGRYIEAYDRKVPFDRKGQYALHRSTIEARYRLGSVGAALSDPRFPWQLYATLQAWGIGRRGSRLAPFPEFVAALRGHVGELAELEGFHVDHVSVPDAVVDAVWLLVHRLPIVDNIARIVAGTKTLHHLLPDLVVPMDRAWTGAFFLWQPAEVQTRQEQLFKDAYRRCLAIARAAHPTQYVGQGWRTSPGKIIDNAIIGYCIEHDIGPGG